ncbi:MAG: ferritin [Armatimonadota bacterium]
MLKEKMGQALNKQINRELYSAYLYLAMAAYLDSMKLKGFSHFLRAQFYEELTHAMKIYDYLAQNDYRAIMMEIPAPQAQWSSPLNVFEEVYKHEQKVTGLINDLVKLADEEQDIETRKFLDWFVKEQVEEEESASEVIEMINRNGEEDAGIAITDKELAKRKIHLSAGA